MVLRPLGNALAAGRSTSLRYVCQALVQSGPLPRAPRDGRGPRAAWWGRRQAGTCVGALRRSYFYPPLGSCPTPPPPTERHPRACREDPGDALSAHRLAKGSRGSCGAVPPALAPMAQPDRGPQPRVARPVGLRSGGREPGRARRSHNHAPGQRGCGKGRLGPRNKSEDDGAVEGGERPASSPLLHPQSAPSLPLEGLRWRRRQPANRAGGAI